MSVQALLEQLRSAGVSVRLEGDRLRLQAPEGVLTPEWQAELRTHRDEIVEFLRSLQEIAAPVSALIPLEARGSRPRFFTIPGHNGDVFCFVPLARALGAEQPLYAFQPPGVDGEAEPLTRIEDLAALFLREVRALQPKGPYHLGGFCTGGLIVFEAALQLRQQGEEVAALVLFGAPGPASYAVTHRLSTPPVRAVNRALRFVRELQRPPARSEPAEVDPEVRTRRDQFRTQVQNATTVAARNYTPRVYPGDLTLFIPSENPRAHYCEQYDDWKLHVRGEFQKFAGPPDCIHSRMLREPFVQSVAERLSHWLR